MTPDNRLDRTVTESIPIAMNQTPDEIDLPRRTPLIYLAPVLPADGMIDQEFDRMLANVALNAVRGDLVARDSLYWAVAGRLEPSIRRYFRLHAQTRQRSFLELEDVRQSGYLVFVDMLRAWPPQESFAAYLFGLFAWRLRRELRTYENRRDVAIPTETATATCDSVSTAASLERSLDRLPERQRLIVRLRLDRNLTFEEISATLGVSPRTIHRDMRAIERAVRMGIPG